MLELPEQAETWIRRALSVALPDSRASRISRLAFGNNLALVLARQGRHDEAILLLDEVIEDKIAVFGPRHPSVLLSRQNQADSYRRLGRLEETVALLEQIRAGNVAVHGEPSLAVAATDNELANAWHDMGAFDLAEAAYRRAYAFFNQYPQADPAIHTFVANNLASLFEDRGDLIEAERWFDRSVQLRAALFAPDSLPYLRGLMNQVRVQIRLGHFEQSGRDLDNIEQALAIHHPEQRERLIQAQLLRAEWQAAAGLVDQARATMANIDSEFVASQPAGSRFDQRWRALQEQLR